MRDRGVLRKIRIFSLGFLLVASGLVGIFPLTAHAAGGLNWDGPWGGAVNWNSSPQNVITPSNVANLQIAWLFAFPSLPDRTSPLAVPGFMFTPQGPGTPPLVHDGVLYENTNGADIYAFDAATGKVLWHRTGLVRPNAPGFHEHGLRYYNGMVWEMIPGQGWGEFVGVDALTGDIKVNITGVALNLPGQRVTVNGSAYAGPYNYGPEWPPAFYKNVALVQLSTTDLLLRGFFAAYDINTGKLLWRWYTNPPAPNCDPNWDFENLVELGNGTTVNYGQPKGNVQPYKGDWGTDCTLNGAAGGWDSPAVDNQTGIFYLQTSSSYPVGYSATRPGPNLWADSIVALNATTGKMIWFYQGTTRDLFGELDCQWSAMLINVDGRKEIAVPCRNYFYGLDAATGQLLWSYDPATVQATGTNPNKYPLEGTNMGNSVNMTEPFAGYPSGLAAYNSSGNENAPAFDGKHTVFWWNSVSATCIAGASAKHTILPPPFFPFFGPPFGGKSCSDAQKAQYKFTPPGSNLAAMDASTGKLEWVDHYDPTQISGYRGGLTYTNGMLLAGTIDGNLRAYDAKTGSVIWTKYVGTALSYAPTIGTTADGKIMVFLPVGGGILWGRTPGFLAAFSLPASSGITTSVATSVSTSVLTSVATVVSTQTVAGGTTGIDPTTFYALAGVAVVFVIATAALVVRRRKPAA